MARNKTFDYKSAVDPDTLASEISTLWTTWKHDRVKWEEQKRELRNYIFATDTTTTTNSSLPWKNTTTTPKLCQIRDNLHANYMAALFPHDDWFKWEPGERNAADKLTAETVTAYMKNKVQQSGYQHEMSKLVYDYIDYGNCYGMVVYENDVHISADGLQIAKYTGPRLVRISPLSIVFNLNAKDFHSTPHIVRSVLSLGELAKLMQIDADTQKWNKDAFNKAIENRGNITDGSYSEDEIIRHGIEIDGFGSLWDYYQSNKVEVLEFYGDIYDMEKKELLENRKIVIIDRAHIVYNEPIDNWLGRSPIEHVGWRYRPDNLIAMGPLDNLVGMQYRIDHLENLRADVFDQIAHPVRVHYGEVEDWDFGPGAEVYADIDARVEFIRPDATALNADMQIRELENKMEEYAGAPRQAMGIRTPGEKTAHEVQTLENNAGRIFQHKTSQFDRVFNTAILNQMLASARANIGAGEVVAMVDKDSGAAQFLTVSPEDIEAKGTLVPKGAYHFNRRAQIFQNIMGWVNSAAYADPAVQTHISGVELARLTQELLDLDAYPELVQPNIRIVEQLETMQVQAQAEQEMAQAAAVDEQGLIEDQQMLEEDFE